DYVPALYNCARLNYYLFLQTNDMQLLEKSIDQFIQATQKKDTQAAQELETLCTQGAAHVCLLPKMRMKAFEALLKSDQNLSAVKKSMKNRKIPATTPIIVQVKDQCEKLKDMSAEKQDSMANMMFKTALGFFDAKRYDVCDNMLTSLGKT